MKHPTLPSKRCIACGAEGGTEFEVEETMHRIGETFRYKICQGCSSLQIESLPSDLSRYYGPDYYSFGALGKRAHPALRTRFMRTALKINTRIYMATGLGRGVSWARQAGVRLDDRVLDFGCGSGSDLMLLHVLGFSDLVGADPFLEEDRTLPGGVQLLSRGHQQLPDGFDWITLHHAFEHVPDPGATLTSLAAKLKPGGRVLIRIPLAGSKAWRTYGAQWAQIDAPRHLALFSEQGFRQLAQSCDFEIERIHYDSTGFQFWGSELVRKGVGHASVASDFFSSSALAEWESEAKKLNAQGDGDQAMFVLKSRAQL